MISISFRILATSVICTILQLFIPAILVGQYVQMNGPYGGRVNCVAASNQVVFAGTEGAGVYKSIDQGQNWHPVNSGISGKQILAMAAFGNNVIFSFAPGAFGSPIEHVFYSPDLGVTWHLANSTPFNLANTFFVDSNVVYAGTDKGLFISQDNGNNWNLVSPALGSIRVNSITKIDTTFFLGTDHGFYFSSNGTTTWTASNSGLASFSILTITSKGNDLYLTNNLLQLYVSHDLGQSWTLLPESGFYVYTIRNRLFLSGYYFSYSDDDAQTWSHTSLKAECHSLCSDGNILYAGTWDGLDNGVCVSADTGITWLRVNNGIIATMVRTLFKTGNRLIAGTMNDGIFISDDGGLNWVEKKQGLYTNQVWSVHQDGNRIYIGTYGAGIFISTDTAETWQHMNHQPPSRVVNDCNIQGPNIFAICGLDNYFSGDSGLTWNMLTDLSYIENNHIFNYHNRLFVTPKSKGIYYSDNAGKSWTPTNDSTGNFYAISETAYGLMSLSSSGIFLSIDSGLTWNLVGSLLWLQEIFSKGNETYSINEYGNLSITNDTASSWNPIFNNSPPKPMLDCLLNGNDLLITFFAQGIWKYDMSGLVNIDEIKKDDVLIFPNPFSNEFSVLLPLTDRIKNISITDAVGRIVQKHLFTNTNDV